VQSQDAVVVGRLVDPDGDHALDDLLSAPFRVKMGESPYLRVVPNEQFAHALSGSAAPSLAEELQACRQVPARVLLAGEVVHSGRTFEIRVSAYDCAQGTRIARTAAGANSRDQLLSALNAASESLRLRLGESPSSLARFNVPLGQATTTSLAALRAYRLGEQQHLGGEDTRARTYFLLAVDLDPQFALAYLQLGRAHSNAGEFTMSRKYYQRAFDLRERTTDRERLYITTSYYSYATGEKERAVEAYQLWSTLYPQDVVPANNLAVEYLTLGRFPEALVAARRAIELDPSLPVPYASLALAYLRSGSLEELRELCSDPARQTSGSVAYHLSCYEGAVGRADSAGMDREMHWARGNPQESVLLGSAATIAFREGRLRESRRLYDAAVSNALSNKLPEYAALLRIDLATAEASVGMSSPARQDALDGVSMGPDGSKEEVSVALVWALSGDVDRANEALQKAAEQSPLDTLLNQALIPQVRAILALEHAKPLEALQYLERIRPYDLCNELDLSAGYYRGVALLQAGDQQRAAAELTAVVAQGRSFPHSLVVPLAQLQAARVAFAAGELPTAVALARDLTHYWQAADTDFPPLRELQELNRELATRHKTNRDPAGKRGR
jgi:tetratricopeptide (TPR) repeat protein